MPYILGQTNYYRMDGDSMKKRVATTILIIGILILGVEMILKPFDGTLGYIVTVVAIMMILSSFVSLCLLNHYRKEETAETVELGLNLIEMILDFFIG